MDGIRDSSAQCPFHRAEAKAEPQIISIIPNACPTSQVVTSYDPLFLHTLTDDTPYPFTNPKETMKDQEVMRQTLRRLLHSLKNVHKSYREKRKSPPPQPDDAVSNLSLENDLLTIKRTPSPSTEQPFTPPSMQRSLSPNSLNTPVVHHNKLNYIFHLSDLAGNDKAVRCIISDVEKFFHHPKFFVIGFFSNTIKDSPVLDKIIAYDEKMVACLPNFPSILCYVTCMKTDTEYFNLVFLENAEAVDKWRKFQFHNKAVATSAKYYKWVRIHNAKLPFSIQALLARDERKNDLEIIRTKYFMFEDGAMTWKGVRNFMVDEVFASSPSQHHISAKPFIVASFLGCNAFGFYKELVRRIGEKTGLPFQMIDVAALTKGQNPRPSDLASISKYNIDFAFTCGISYVQTYPNLIALVAPVRRNSRYNDKPVYFCDFVVRADSPYYKMEDLKGKRCAINEHSSFSGYHFPQYYFGQLGYGSIESFFGSVYASGAHSNSLRLLEEGKIDCAPLDSVVLDMEFQQNPERRSTMRVISTYGPATMPPVVSAVWVTETVRKLITKVFKNLHKTEKEFLEQNGFSRFQCVNDDDYHVVRNMLAAESQFNSENK